METKICVVGLGYVGLPLAVEFNKYFSVVGFDVNKERIDKLREGIDFSGEIGEDELKSSKIVFTDCPEQIKEANFIVVCVPTPVDKGKKPDLSFLESASEIVGRNLRSGSVVVYESTVYPGCTEEICVPLLEKFSGLKCGGGFKVGYSPERINPGDKEHILSKVVKIVSAMDKESLERVSEIYGKIVKAGLFKAKDIKTAEAAKVIENIQRDLNIALVNELALIFDRMGIKTKDVLEAAGTKWNFHKYYPGVGPGGHCFNKNSIVFLMNNNHLKIKQIGDFIDSLSCKKQTYRDVEIFYPEDVKILSFDMVKNKTSFRPVTIASKRRTDKLLNIKCVYNYGLEVTDCHPVVIYDGNLKLKLAKDVKPGDKLVLNKLLPSGKRKINVNLLGYLNEKDFDKIRVRPKNKSFADFKQIINKNLRGNNRDYYKHNFLPLKKYLKIEHLLGIKRKDIFLRTGRGYCSRNFPCVIAINKDFLRLVGYYLSEGCLTEDKALRIRFTFNRKEKGYIKDLKNILNKLNIDYSVYEDKNFQSTTLKVSSYLLGFLLRDILKCGTNCYNMQIPEIFFDFSKKHKEELLKGLFRGDGGVYLQSGKRKYKKKNKEFVHNINSVEVSYFSSSSILFQQIILFLLNQNILPKLAKRKGYLTIAGFKNISIMKEWFLGEKKEKIDSYLKNLQKKITCDKAERFKSFITANVKKIEKIKTDYVYSVEVPETSTLVTTTGIIAHNCIPVDPYYLTYKAEQLGYNPQVILAGRNINDYMAKHIAELVIKGLNETGKVPRNSKVLLLGLTFKEDVKDHRNSRAVSLINHLKAYGVEVMGCDPLLENEVVKRVFGIENKKLEEVEGVDGVVLVTRHGQFKKLGLERLKAITKDRPFLVDTKFFFEEEEAVREGFVYKTL